MGRTQLKRAAFLLGFVFSTASLAAEPALDWQVIDLWTGLRPVFVSTQQMNKLANGNLTLYARVYDSWDTSKYVLPKEIAQSIAIRLRANERPPICRYEKNQCKSVLAENDRWPDLLLFEYRANGLEVGGETPLASINAEVDCFNRKLRVIAYHKLSPSLEVDFSPNWQSPAVPSDFFARMIDFGCPRAR